MVQAIGAQRAGMDVDSAGAVMGASTQQMRGAVLGRLRADFSLVAMKAGCLRAFEALRGGGAAAVPPASAAALPGVGLVLVPPSSVAFAAPVVQAVAVSAGGGSGAGVLGGAGWGGSRPWIFAVWVVVFPRFGGGCVPIGLFWSYVTRSVRVYSIHTFFLRASTSAPAPPRARPPAPARRG